MSSIRPTIASGRSDKGMNKTVDDRDTKNEEKQVREESKTNTRPPPRGVGELCELRKLGRSRK